VSGWREDGRGRQAQGLSDVHVTRHRDNEPVIASFWGWLPPRCRCVTPRTGRVVRLGFLGVVCVRYRQGFPTALHPISPNPGVSTADGRLFFALQNSGLGVNAGCAPVLVPYLMSLARFLRLVPAALSSLALPPHAHTRNSHVVCGSTYTVSAHQSPDKTAATAAGTTGFNSPRSNR
jgi:hypothetical protein